ncbi:MAG: bifunctional demethylmenaquinone methyltransferase/2-methoxy-6-polyprenyl-1,4-benzoquinol methylase UbiE [Pseudomonadota bacterium]
MSFNTTDFGYKQVPINEKTKLVASLFTSVADKYDLMNDVMSMGMHRIIKHRAVRLSGVKAGDYVLDLAGGTGDLAVYFSKIVGIKGRVILADINEAMLKRGKKRVSEKIGTYRNVIYITTDAELLPFYSNSFDCVAISFGMRNFTDKMKALNSVKRVLKPNGKLIILDFSKPEGKILQKAYYIYSFRIVPIVAKLLTGKGESYRYLAESIRMHPDQKKLKEMMEEGGFSRCCYCNMMHGITALHEGTKPGEKTY